MTLPPILLISCPEEPARYTEGMAHFLERDIPIHTVLSGIHGETFGLHASRPYNTIKHALIPNSFSPPKHVGLCLSHYMAWQAIQVAQIPEAIILEIDARFPNDWKEKIFPILESPPPDYDIILLGSCYSKPLNIFHNDLHKIDTALCTHAYVVRQKAIDTLLANMRTCHTHVDIALAERVYPKLNVWAPVARIAEQDRELPP